MLKLFVIEQLVQVETCRLGLSTHYITLRKEGGGLTICYMRYIRVGGLFLLMLYNAIHLRSTECFT